MGTRKRAGKFESATSQVAYWGQRNDLMTNAENWEQNFAANVCLKASRNVADACCYGPRRLGAETHPRPCDALESAE